MVTRQEFCDGNQRIVRLTPEGFWSSAITVKQEHSTFDNKWQKPSVNGTTFCDVKPNVTAAQICAALAEAYAEASEILSDWAVETNMPNEALSEVV